MDYSYFTRKQAGILYSAIKQNKLSATKNTIDRMYQISKVPGYALSQEDRVFRDHLENALNFYLEDQLEYAQAELDGKRVVKKYEVVDTVTREATEDDWFYDLGELITEEIKEPRYYILD